MQKDPEIITDLSPLNPIRVETALSRYPVHRLARKGSIDINIREGNEYGETIIRWEVDYSKKHGQPGPLAYKLDTLIVNRRIEEATRPIPKLIKLGSLRDICRELGLSEGENVNTIRKALRQNAFAGITAKTRYKLADGTEKTLEADFTRYSVVFTGEELPTGKKADAVYLILNDVYLNIISGAMTRPLDYDYLKSLSPAPQRFYEILSYQMYATIKHDRPRAKLVYSEFCTYAPQTRHDDWESVRSQMNKVHRPHRKSGYIADVDSQQTVDNEGNPDWIMLYTPGPRARAEYRTFTKRGGPSKIEVEQLPLVPENFVPKAKQLTLELEPSPLALELIQRQVTKSKAIELVEQLPAEFIEMKLEVFDWLVRNQDKRVGKSPAGWLVKSMTDDFAIPKGFVSKAEQQRQQEARQAKERKDAEHRRSQQEKDAAERELDTQVAAYRKSQTQEQLARLEADAIAQASEETRRNLDDPAMKPFRKTLISRLVKEHIAHLLQAEAKSLAPA
jgi:hypothetical protein